MRVHVTHGIDDLASDLADIAARVKPDMRGVVNESRRSAERLAKGFAREKAGPHGKDYYKRISSEMTGLLSAEIGPTGIPKSEFVGVGFRHGTNTDLARTSDIVGPAFARAVRDQIDGWFW